MPARFYPAAAGAWRSIKIIKNTNLSGAIDSSISLEFATLEWVDWFNHRRLLQPIGNIPPAEAEERYYAMLDEAAKAA